MRHGSLDKGVFGTLFSRELGILDRLVFIGDGRGPRTELTDPVLVLAAGDKKQAVNTVQKSKCCCWLSDTLATFVDLSICCDSL